VRPEPLRPAHEDRARDARGVRGPGDREPHGDRRRPHRGRDVRPRRTPRRDRRRAVRDDVRTGERDDGLPPWDRGIHRRGARWDREPPGGGARWARARRLGVRRAVPPAVGRPRAFPVRAPRRDHVLDPRARADLPAGGHPRDRRSGEGVTRAAFVRAVKGGLLGGVGVIYFALVGMIERLDTLAIVGSVELSWLVILGPPFLPAYVLAPAPV